MTLLNILTAGGPKKEGSYIVVLNPATTADTHLAQLQQRFSNITITHVYDFDFMNSYAGTFPVDTLDYLRGSSEVQAIYEDAEGDICGTVTDKNVAWNLQRVSHKGKVTPQNPTGLNFNYVYDSAGQIQGVTIYVLDTGIMLTHNELTTRAKLGFVAPGVKDDTSLDSKNHGTGVASVIAGTTLGVVKQSSIIDVKVGNGLTMKVLASDVLAGLSYVYKTAPKSDANSIVHLSFSMYASDATVTLLDTVVTQLVSNSKIYFVAPAGDNNKDAGEYYPAKSKLVVSVGGTTIADERWRNSNYGAAVDIWAPAASVRSASTSPADGTGVSWGQGTCFAAAHVTGLIAYFMNLGLPDITAQDVASEIRRVLKEHSDTSSAATENEKLTIAANLNT